MLYNNAIIQLRVVYNCDNYLLANLRWFEQGWLGWLGAKLDTHDQSYTGSGVSALNIFTLCANDFT